MATVPTKHPSKQVLRSLPTLTGIFGLVAANVVIMKLAETHETSP